MYDAHINQLEIIMKIKTEELKGVALDYAVAIANGVNSKIIRLSKPSLTTWMLDEDGSYTGQYMTGPSLIFSRWETAGPIIEKEMIQLNPSGVGDNAWTARIKQKLPPGMNGYFEKSGSSPLIAAMRCYVASKLGEVVNVPKELNQ